MTETESTNQGVNESTAAIRPQNVQPTTGLLHYSLYQRLRTQRHVVKQLLELSVRRLLFPGHKL